MAETYWDQLRKASWRNFEFVVEDSSAGFGRRNAVHEYPFRDVPWIEDIGAQAKRFMVRGFIFGDDVIAQRDRLERLAAENVDGELIHPTLGSRKVALMDVRTHERKDRGRVIELHMTFVQQGAQVYPAATQSTAALTKAKAVVAKAAVAESFVTKLRATLSAGQGALAQVSAVTKQAMSALDDLGVSAGLQPGQLSQAASVVAGDIIRGRQSATALRLGLDELRSITSALGGSTAGKYAAAVINSMALAAATGTLNKTSIRGILGISTTSALLESSPHVGGGGSPAAARVAAAGSAAQGLMRQAAVVASAELSADYQPQSSADAAEVRDMVAQAIEREAVAAADAGDDAAYAALKGLRAAVVADLNARAALLPVLVEVKTSAPVSSLVLAHRLYADAARADELVGEARPVHPAFMPTAFRALSG